MEYENQENEDFIVSENGEIYTKKERDFKGIWIEKEIYLCPKEILNWTEKLLLIEICSLSKQKGCFAGNQHFANFLGCSTTTISIGISKLKELKLIKEIDFNGRKRILKADKLHIAYRINLINKIYIDLINNKKLPLSSNLKAAFKFTYKQLLSLLKAYNNTYKNNNEEVFNKLNTYSESDDSHQSSLKKQMALENNSDRQKISNKKERRKLSQEDEDKIRNCPFTMRIINLWNSFSPVTPQHKSPSLIWKSIHLSLNQLRKGIFYKRHNWAGSYFDLFCEINKITSQQIKNMLDRPFKKKEIIEGIKLFPSYCKEGNFIKKQSYSKTLSLMFYNDESPFVSMFALALIKGEANPVSESMEIKCKYPRLAEKFKKIEDRRMCIDYDKMSVMDKKQFNKVFSKIEERLNSIPKECSYYNLGLEDFIRTYYDQLQYLNLDKIELITFSPWSWQWKRVCGSESGSFNQIKKWLLEEKDIADLERKKEYRKNNPVSDDNHYDN